MDEINYKEEYIDLSAKYDKLHSLLTECREQFDWHRVMDREECSNCLKTLAKITAYLGAAE